MINEEVVKPKVEKAPFGLFSPAVVVKHEYIEGSVIQQRASIVNSKVLALKWDNLFEKIESDSSVSVYTSPSNKIYQDGYAFEVILETEISSLNLAFESDVEKAIDQIEDASLQQAIEKRVWTILNDNVVASATTEAVKSRYGFALLEGYFGNKSFGETGLIHAPRNIASAYKGKIDGEVLLSTIGSPIIAGTGYPYDANKIFMTGPITIRIGTSDTFFEVDRVKNIVHAQRTYPVVVSILDGPFSAQIDLSKDYS